jgi:hypothetical protein
VVRTASEEVLDGEHVQLDWGLDNLQFPGFGRRQLTHNIIDAAESSHFKAIDDEIHLNTQSGSQWDSLKHFAHQASGKYYNGITHNEAARTAINGIHNWVERGGIVGRGVLCDWLRWHEQTRGPVPSATTRYEIPIEEIKATLAWQRTSLRQGDILMIRSGYVRWHK